MKKNASVFPWKEEEYTERTITVLIRQSCDNLCSLCLRCAPSQAQRILTSSGFYITVHSISQHATAAIEYYFHF